MASREEKLHSDWLGLVQQDGLVVSPMVLAEKECHIRQPISVQQYFLEEKGLQSISDLGKVLKWSPKALRSISTSCRWMIQ